MLLNDKLKPYRLLLASQSPRRRELMTGCGLPYELAEKFDCEETYPDDLPLIGVSEYLSTLKSEAYPVPLLENDILLTADTVVLAGGEFRMTAEGSTWHGGEILGKPRDRDDARRMLKILSGAHHLVTTGVTLRSAARMLSEEATITEDIVSETVSEAALSDASIDAASTEEVPTEVTPTEETAIQDTSIQARKITHAEISTLPRRFWPLANNSFLLHGCHNYHHLLLIKEKDHLWLGVPGLYDPREAHMANLFGFPQFTSSYISILELTEDECENSESFGHWCRYLM